MAEIKIALQQFWEVGVKQVSPGALGMVMRGEPYDNEYGKFVAQNCSQFCRWDGTWIVLEREPNACNS